MNKLYKLRPLEAEQAVQAQAQSVGISANEQARIISELLREPMQTIHQAFEALLQKTAEEISDMLLQLSQRVDALESAQGATTHFHMV